MAKIARDFMTPSPACCTAKMSIVQVAKMMMQNDCGEIPVIDTAGIPIGVITDRDIVCRIVAEGRNPASSTVEQFMSQPIVTVRDDDSIEDVVSTMEKHQIRRVPVTDERGMCSGIIAQADVAWMAAERSVAQLVREVSRDTKQ
jgi:CBS domain-containing protein